MDFFCRIPYQFAANNKFQNLVTLRLKGNMPTPHCPKYSCCYKTFLVYSVTVVLLLPKNIAISM